MLPDGLLTSAEYKHDVDIAPCVLELDPFASDDCLDDLSPPRPFLLTPFEELNTMNMSDDEPSSGLNGRLRPRKSAVQSPQTTKPFRRSESRSSQERPKRTSTPSKVLTKTDDLANKSESSPNPHYLCPFCDRKFAAKQAISKHVHRMHSKQAPVMGCLFCNHAEAEPTDIIRHMVDSHPNQYFACLDCHTRFPSTTELAEHKLNVCEKQKLPYRNKLRQKAGKSKKGQKSIKIDDKDFETDSKTFPAGHGFNGIVISCELKPSQVHDDADIEDNITTNLILPPSKTLGSSAVLDKNAVIVLDDIQWNKRIPSNFSFHNTDADQILSRLGVVHRSPRTGEPTRRDWLRTIDDATQKFEKCFDTSFYSKVASNVQENLNKFLDGSFNFNPDPDSMIKTRKSKMSVVINTAEGFPILLACEQYSRNAFDGYMPRAIAPRHKWKWDNLETDRTTLSADQIKRDSHTNNCIITLVSSLDIWTQLCMRRKYEEKYSYSPLAKKTDKQTATENELKEILESREIPTTSSQVIKQRQKPPAQNDAQDFPACLGLAPSTPKYELPPAVLSGEWVRPRCYVCCACGTPTYDSRALSAHMATRHPNAQVQHYEVVGELLLNADILKHLYVPPSQMHNRTRPLRGIRECTKCKKSITLEDLHQHMLDCAGDTPAVRRKCRYRPFGVRKRRPRLPDNRIRKKMRKDIRNRQNNQKTHMRARPRANRSEVGDAETIRKMLADLPAKRHRVLVNPMNSTLRPRRKLDKHRNKLLMKRHQSDDTKNRKLRTMKTKSERSGSSADDRNSSPTGKYDDDDDKPLKRPVRRVPVKGSRQKEAMKRKAVLNRARRKLNAAAEQASVENETPDIEVPNTSGVEINQISIQNNSQRLDVNSGSYNSRENSNRGSHGDDGSVNREQPPPGHNDQNGNSNNQRGDQAQNTPLKHSIARLTADCETHNKPVEFHHAFTIQQDCSDLNQHVPSEHRLLFENEAAATKLDKPPLDLGATQKSKKNKVKRLNDCIAMLRMKNKLTDSGSGESTSTPQADNDDQRGDKPVDRGPTQAPIDDKPAEIFHRHNINDLAMDRQFERPYEYTREGKFIPPMNHPIPIPYEMIPMMMGMPQPEDLRVVQAMETPSKPKTRRSSTRAQQCRATRPSIEAIPTIPPFMIPANPYEMAMAPPMPYPGQVSQRRSSASRMLVNISTETNRPPTLDLPSPNRLSPRQVSPRQISPRQMMMNIEMMRDMNYDRPSPNKLSPLQIFTPDIRARSELRSPRQSHAYDPQFLSRVGHRQISPRHGLEIDPRRLAMELYQHSNQPSVPTQISPIQAAQAHALYASKLAQMPVSYRQTSPVPDYKVPKQISPMQDNQCYDIPSLYKVPKQVSPKQLSQAFDTFPPSKLPSPKPKHTEQALDNLANKKVDQCSSKNPDQALDKKKLPSKVIPPGSSKQGSLPLDLQLSNKIPSSGQASSKQGNHASDLISKTPTEIQDSSKHPSHGSEAPTPGQILGLDSSSKPAIMTLDSSTKMSVPIQESSESASQALDLQLKSCQLPVSGQSSTQKVSQDFDLHSSNKMPSPGQDATKHGCQISETPKKLTSQGSESETLQESNHASDLQSSSKMSSTGQNPSKLASQVVEKSKITASVESSNPITKVPDIQASENSAPSPPQQESQVAEQQPSRKLPSKQVSPRSASQAYEMKSHSRSSNFISSKQVDLSPDIQPEVKQSPKNVSNQSSSTQAQDITTETKIPKQQEQPSKHVNQKVTLKAKPIEELQSKPKTRASSRSSQGPTSRTRATRASSRALKLRSSSQPDPAPEITKLQSQTRESHVPSRESHACSRLIQSSESEMRETDAQKREFNPKIREHQTQESTPQTPEHYHLKRESPLQSREPKSQARKPHPRTGERQTLEPHIGEHKTLEFDTQMQNPHLQTREPIPKIRESHQSREPQTQESLTKEFQMRETKMLESQMRESQMRESQMRESQMRESQMRESQMRESQMRESQMRESQMRESQMLESQMLESQMLESQMLESQMLESQMRESQIRESQMRESQMRESQLRESQMFENQMRESQMRESQLRESQMFENQMRESQMRESQMRESQMRESQMREAQIRESQMRESQILESQILESQIREFQMRESQMLLQQMCDPHPQMPFPQMRDSYSRSRELHVQAQHHEQIRESQAHAQSNAQVREQHPHTRESRTPTQEPQMREPLAYRQDTQAREIHAQQSRVHTQPRESQIQHREPHVQGHNHNQPQDSYAKSRRAQPRETQLELGDPQTQKQDFSHQSLDQNTQQRDSYGPPQSHHHKRVPHAPQEPQAQNRESHLQSREPYIQQQETNVQLRHHALSQSFLQTEEPQIGIRDHDHSQTRESQTQETYAQTQSHPQTREMLLRERESDSQHRDPFSQHTNPLEAHTPLQEPPAKHQSHSKKQSRIKAQESNSLSQEELIQLREPHSQLRDLHTQLREPEPPLRETHGQSLESHTQSQREFYSHTHLQSQSQSTQRPYLLFAPPPPPPPPEDAQQVITQIQLETPQQPWQSNVFDMSMIRQSSADAANEQIARNMSVEMYSETEYPHMHPSIPLAHTGNLLDNLPLVPLDLSSKTPEACENARKLETSYVSHYERYETLDLSNKNNDLTKRDEDVVVDLRVKPTSQSSSISLHELSDIPVDEMVDVTDAYPKDLSVKKHIDIQNITNNQAYDDQDFSNDQVVETPTDLSGRIIPVSSHYLLNANDARLLPMTDQFSHSAQDGLPLMSNMDEEPETANSFSGKRQNEIASTFANMFIPPPPPPPPPPQEDTQTDEIEKSNSIEKQEAEHTSQLPEHKIKTSNTPDIEETSDDLRSQANKTPSDVHATVSNNASLTCSPGYTSPNLALSAQSSNRHDAEYALAKAFMSVSSKTGTDDVSTESLISRFSYSIPSTTANTSSVYTLASTSRGLTSNSGKSSQVGCENALEIERQINTEQDPETARKIALLPKELVEILGNMPPDHRNQLLNVLPQYVSHTTSSDQSNSHKQVEDVASNTTDLSKIPLPVGSGPTSAKFLQSKPVSEFESSVNYQNAMVPPASDNIYSAENVRSPKLSDNLEPDVKHSFPLPLPLCDVNKSDDIKPGICGKITVSENKIDVINLEKSETVAEVYNNPTIIDLTEDDNSPTNPIVNIVKTSEGFPPNIVVTPTILPAVKLTKVTKVKTTNEKTSSLRAVRIKTPLERHKSVSTDLQVPKNILEKDSTALDDNELTRKTLAIQQSEVSSTQQQKKDAVKLSSQLSPTVTELNAEATEPVKIQQNIPVEQQPTQDEIENKPAETKAVLVSSSISTSGLLVDKQSLHKIISSDVQINLTPCDLNKTVLNDNQKLRITVSDHSMQSTSRLVKDCTEVKTNSKGKKNVQDDDEDSDDDISLAVIVKQKQLDQPSTFKSNVLDSKHDADRKKKRKDKYTKKRPIDKQMLVKEKSGTLKNLESVESATTVNADRDKNQNLEESETGNISYKSNILTRDEQKLSKKKTKKSRRGKKIFTTSSTNVIDTHNLSLHESIVDHNSVSSSSNKDQEVDLEMKVTGKISPSVFEDESQEIVYNQKRNKTKKKIVPKLSQSPLPISPLKTKKILSDYDNSVLDDQDDIRYNCKRIAEPDSCSIIELSDTQDSLMLDSVNTEESNSESITESRKYKTNSRLNKSKRNEFSNDSEQTSKIIDNLVTPLRRSRRGKSLFVDKLSDPEGITQTDLCAEQKTPLTKKQLIFSKLLLDEENTKPHSLSPLETHPENPEDCPNIPQSTAEISSKINKNLEPTTEESKVIEMEVTNDFQENNKSKEIEEFKQETTKELKASKSDVTAINNETEATENISESCTDALEYQKVLEKDTLEIALEKNKATKRRQSPQVKRKVKKPKSVESSEHTLEDMDTDSSHQLAADSESEKANTNLNSTKSKKDTFDKTDSNNVISEVASSENKAKLEINKPPSSAEKRKNSEYTEVEQITKHKKCRFNYKETNNKDPVSEHSKPTTDKCATQDKNTTSTNIEVRTTCYKPVAARRTRSKSAVVKSSAEILYDPYDIDFDEMIQRNEPISKKGKSSITKTVPSSYVGNTSTPIKGASAKAQKKVPNVVEDETLRDDIMDEDIRGNISDSDDSSKSDVPLQKYVEEKGKRMSLISPSKVLDDDTDTEQELGGDKNNSNDSKSSRKTLAVCNNVEGGAGQSETEEQLRSEQFMESFGFFSERKPRKSNLLASKKISETFHIIANESDDVYFGYKDRSSKKMHQESKKNDEGKHSKSNKKETKRGRKKKSFVKPEPCYCHVCKKEFRRPDNFLRHQMSLIHISKLTEVEFKVKTLPIHEEPNYLIAYKQYLDRLKALTDKLAKKKKHKGSRKIKLPTVEEILADLNKTIREQQFSQRGLSNDEALFLDCCELLQEMPIKNDKSNTDASAIGNSCQTSSNEMRIEKNLDDTKSDGDVDSITAKTILESEEVRNLENDLISNLKEAASANAAKSKLNYQQVLVAESQQEPIETSANSREAQYEQVKEIEIPEKTEKPVSEKSKREREILVDEKEFVYKEKMYPDIIEDIDMFEDKFDKIKRKCRSQAAAAKQTQVIPEPSESHKSRRKSDKKKGKKTKKSHQSSQVPTKGALKGFDGVKVSISPNDISMTNISPAAEEKEKDRDKEREKDKDKEKDRDKNREKEREKDREKERDKEKDRDKDKEKDKEKKKKKKGSSKKKRDKKDSESSSKYDSDQKNKEISTQKKIDVYEFMDNEDAELFEFRPSTLMERFKKLSKDSQSTSTSNLVADEVDMSSESASDGDDFVYMSDDYVCSDDETENSLLSCEMGTGKVGKEKTSSPLKRKDAVEKNAVMGKIFKHNAVRSEKKVSKSKEAAKSKANLDQLFDSLLEDEPSLSTGKGDSSPQKELTEAESYSSLPGSTYEPSSSKYEPPSRYEPSTSKFEPSTSRYESSSSKYEPSTSKAETSSTKFEPSPSTSKYEPSPSTSKYEPSTSKPSTSKYEPQTCRYEPSTSKYEPLTVTSRDSSEKEFALPQKITSSHRYESMPSTSKRPQRPSLQAEEFRFSPRKYDSTDEDYGPSTSKRFESSSSDVDYGPSSSKKYDMKSPQDCKLFSPKKFDSRKYNTDTSKGNECSTSRYSSTSMRNEDGSFKRRYSLDKSPRRKSEEEFCSTYDYGADVFEDDAGVARQRARRKCTVGKQNVLAESWSSESEPERAPPRPTSAESVLSSGGRKKKGRKKESQPLGGRRGKVTFRRQEFESRVSSSNRNTSSGGGGSSYTEYGSGTSSSVSTGVQVSLSPGAQPGPSGVKPRSRAAPFAWPDADDEQEHLQQHGWIVGDSHKKLVTMLAHAKGRKRNNDDKRHLVE